MSNEIIDCWGLDCATTEPLSDECWILPNSITLEPIAATTKALDSKISRVAISNNFTTKFESGTDCSI